MEPVKEGFVWMCVLDAWPTISGVVVGLAPPHCNDSCLCGTIVLPVLEESKACSFRVGGTSLLTVVLSVWLLNVAALTDVADDDVFVNFCCSR